MRENWVEIQYKDIVKKISLSNKKLKQKEYLPSGKIPVIDQGQELIGGYTDDESKLLDCKLPCVVFGDHTKIVKLINFPFASGADGTKVIEPKKYLEPKLLKYFTEVLALKIKDKGYARHYQDIEKSNILIPPKLEQKEIIAKIEQLFSELDNGIENLKTSQAKLKIYRQAVLKKAFEGELTKEWRNKNSIDFDWNTIPLKNAKENVSTTNRKLLQKEYAISKGNIPVIDQGQELIGGYSEKKELMIEASKYPHIVFGDHTKIIKYIDFDFIAGADGTKIMKPLKAFIPKLFFYFIHSIKIPNKGYARHFQFLEKSKIPVPPINEQKKMLEEIEVKLSVCEKIEKTIEVSLSKSEALRQSILKKAFEGNLLSQQELINIKSHPKFESAEALLERIKKEREQ
ncbi:restriction endonuclease subunit S [Aliarcobacter butzleri]|uniref:restriction endonuclease subunit S n=1 Tax=Aliarcobacter butzleri TaxID=28197 RepID=UPI001EDA6AF2|nr:restriction endonuclease subunit S [Aliarcobacter butzleri]MCG3684422.1 restriction endonuclease subunit S [Aliarcobacter butzleri]